MIESRAALPSIGTVVTVVFLLSSDGRVARIEEVKSEPEGAGAKYCVSAITRRGTFNPWSEEMKRVLGREQKMTFTFHYEDSPAEKPNKAPEPTTLLVTPRADARVAPSRVVAHL